MRISPIFGPMPVEPVRTTCDGPVGPSFSLAAGCNSSRIADVAAQVESFVSGIVGEERPELLAWTPTSVLRRCRTEASDLRDSNREVVPRLVLG